MRLPIALLIALFAVPASASAATVGLEGAELVYRADAGHDGVLTVVRASDAVLFHGAAIVPGPGCAADGKIVRCEPARMIRVLTGDGHDRLDIHGRLPVTADLGPGNDAVYTVGGGTDLTLIGGEGDDEFGVNPGAGTAAVIDCGPGDDRWSAGPRSRPGDGCAAHLTGISAKSVSRAFREGALTAPASGSVTLRRRGGLSALARGTFTAQAGPLRVSLKPTSAGRRALRRDPTPRVDVFVRTRSGGDRGETIFASRLG